MKHIDYYSDQHGLYRWVKDMSHDALVKAYVIKYNEYGSKDEVIKQTGTVIDINKWRFCPSLKKDDQVE
jgi:hypothetical protein